MQQKIIQEFQQRFNVQPEYIIQAPGRVNIIGEHTDYNAGFVLPMAIDRYIWLALKPRPDRQINIYAINFQEQQSFNLDDILRRKRTSFHPSWIDYVKGIAWIFQQQLPDLQLVGFDGVLYGDIPCGAGLSSSAALELTIARAFAAMVDFPWNPMLMAKLAQQAENQWVGVNCGIMDQMAIALGKDDHALFIDCRDLTIKNIPLPIDFS
jgi:galactokinase